MSHWDVIVCGLGGVGSSATYHLASSGLRGLRVLGIDQFPPVHAYGSSHGQSRAIRQAYFEHPAYVPLLRRAYDLWDDLEQASNRKLFHRTSIVEIGPSDGVVVPGVQRSAVEHGLDIEEITMAEVTHRWPSFQGDDAWKAVVENNAGLLRVEDCVATHLDLAKAAGAVCRHNEIVHSWQATQNCVEVTTSSGTEHASNLVIAAGAWTGRLLESFGIPMRVLRKHQYWFETVQSAHAIESGFPSFFYETPEGYFYGFPAIDSLGVKVARHSGGRAIRTPSPSNDHAPNSEVDIEDKTMVSAFNAKQIPNLSSRVTKQSSCYYTVTPDEHFVIDVLPGRPNVKLIGGLSGHGFKFTSVLGKIASEMVTGESTLSTDLFRIARFVDRT